MSKQAIGWCFALVAVVGFVVDGQLIAQQPNDDPFGTGEVHQAQPPAVQVRAVAQNAEQRINTALDQRLKTPLNYEAEQLDLVLAAIAYEYDIPIVFDKAALDEVAISSESEVSVKLRNVSLQAALNLIFKEPGLEDLCYFVDEEVLLVTTQEKANETLVTKVYRIDDFKCFSHEEKDVSEKPSKKPSVKDFSAKRKLCFTPVPLIKALVNCVEYDSWMANGTGEGAVFRMKPGLLVVTQTRRVHRQVEDFLGKLRVIKAEIENDGPRVARY